MPNTNLVSVTPETETAIGGATLVSILDELTSMPEDDVLQPRVDVPTAAHIAIGASPKIELHRAALVARFGETAARSIDRVVPLARAMAVTHADLVMSIEAGLEDTARELGVMRTLLHTDAQILIERKLLRPNALSGLAGGQAYLDRANDVLALVRLFRVRWAKLSALTNVTETDLDRAESLMEKFAKLHAIRDQASVRASGEGRLRARAFTLFFQTYDHVRQMLVFLRWDQRDADEIAPSLFGGRSRRRDDDDATDVAPVTPAPVVAPTPTTPASPSPVSAPVAAPATPNRIPPGMPGADPFQS